MPSGGPVLIRIRVLVVEDDPSMQDLYDNLFGVVHRDKFLHRVVDDGETALSWLERKPYDVVILDLDLPGMGGLKVLKWIHTNGALRAVHVVIVSGKKADRDRLAGLDGGADDYMVKPFNTDELLLRIRNLMERRERLFVEQSLYDLGWLQVDPERPEITVEGRAVHLEPQELGLVVMLMRRCKVVFHIEDLYDSLVWRTPRSDIEHAVGNKISSLRGKLGRGGACIRNHKGIGYSFDPSFGPRPAKTPA